ncbi:secreted protein [Beggiatoa sp. PS]|nr:secreted protein [Beggiatoa sp. PS]
MNKMIYITLVLTLLLGLSSAVFAGKHSLTVNAVPPDSDVRIMNIEQKYFPSIKRFVAQVTYIEQKYFPGVKLESGRYEISVEKSDYFPKKQWVKIEDKDVTTHVFLSKKTSQITKPPTKQQIKKYLKDKFTYQAYQDRACQELCTVKFDGCLMKFFSVERRIKGNNSPYCAFTRITEVPLNKMYIDSPSVGIYINNEEGIELEVVINHEDDVITHRSRNIKISGKYEHVSMNDVLRMPLMPPLKIAHVSEAEKIRKALSYLIKLCGGKEYDAD